MTPNPNPDPYIAWNIILTIGVLVAIGANLVSVFRGNKREISILPDAVSKTDFAKHVEGNASEHRDIFSKIGGVDRGANRKVSEEVLHVHNRINALEKSVGGLETASNLTNQRLSQIDAKIDRLIERKS